MLSSLSSNSSSTQFPRKVIHVAAENRIGGRIQHPDIHNCKTVRDRHRQKYRSRRPTPAAPIVFHSTCMAGVDQNPTATTARRMALLAKGNQMWRRISYSEIH